MSGSGSETLTFSYTAQAGDLSTDLDYQSAGALTLNGATIRSATSDDATLTLPALGSADSIAGQHDLVIDGVAPSVSSVSVPANGTYVAGQNLDFTVNFNEAVTIDSLGGTPQMAITLDTGGTVYAEYLSGSGSSALVFRLTVTSGQLDSNGISVGGGIELNGGALRDATGNDASSILNGVGTTSGVLVDALAPAGVSFSVQGSPASNASTVTFVLRLSEPVSGLDLGDFQLTLTGSATGTLADVQAQDAQTYLITVSGIQGQGSLGIVLPATGSGVQDVAGNPLAADVASGLHAVAPVVEPVPAPSPAVIVLRPGQAVEYTVPLGALMGDDLMRRSSILVESGRWMAARCRRGYVLTQ